MCDINRSVEPWNRKRECSTVLLSTLCSVKRYSVLLPITLWRTPCFFFSSRPNAADEWDKAELRNSRSRLTRQSVSPLVEAEHAGCVHAARCFTLTFNLCSGSFSNWLLWIHFSQAESLLWRSVKIYAPRKPPKIEQSQALQCSCGNTGSIAVWLVSKYNYLCLYNWYIWATWTRPLYILQKKSWESQPCAHFFSASFQNLYLEVIWQPSNI